MTKDTNSACILVVDDTDLNRQFMRHTLGKLGYEVVEAENGKRALALVGSRHIDLVLLDITMPEMDGLEVLSQLRKRFSLLELPVIMFTADDQEKQIVDALSRGANDYLLKPVNVAVAAARIKTQLSIASLSKLKDDVVRFASHDLKKPMLVMADIIAMARDVDLQNQGKLDELKEFLGLLATTNQRMQDVVHGFLVQKHFQTADVGAVPTVDLNALIRQSIEANAVYAQRKQTTLSAELSPELPRVQADSFKLKQVLENLIGNAIKFSPLGARVKVRSLMANDSVRVEVIDNGPGLTAEDQHKLFKRGAVLSNKPTGGEDSSGIGLSLCKDMIDALGGEIGACNNADKGSTFWFTLK